MGHEWVKRLADIPGVGYLGMTAADRQRVRGHDAVPEVHRFGGQGDSLWWGSTTASPAQTHQLSDQGVPTKRLLRHLAETLELPGIASDYHFAIQNVIGELMRRRVTEPDVVEDVERLCLLNVALVEARPEAVTRDLDGSPEGGFVQMLCFPTLIRLYEDEGALPEALAVAERALRFGHCEEAHERLAARRAAVEAEDQG